MDRFTFDPEHHRYFLNNEEIPSVTHILEDLGFVNYDMVNAATREASLKFGSAVHLACQLDDNDDLVEESLDPALAPYLEGWRKFKKQCKVEIITNEKSIYSARHKIAGTPDRIGSFRKRTTLIDIKTGLIEKWVRLQTAGYKIIHDEQNPKNKIRQRIGVQLLPGKYKLVPFEDKSDLSYFLNCVQFYKGKEVYK